MDIEHLRVVYENMPTYDAKGGEEKEECFDGEGGESEANGCDVAVASSQHTSSS